MDNELKINDLIEYINEHTIRGSCTCGRCVDAPHHTEEHQPIGHTDKEAYRRFVADMKQLEAEFKADNPLVVGVAGEDLGRGDMVYKNSDGKMYKSDCIPAKLQDVCEWWISKYKRTSTFDEHTIESNIAENMEYILKRKGR